MQFAMPYAIGGDDPMGKEPNILDRAAQYDNLETIIMIHVDMHAG